MFKKLLVFSLAFCLGLISSPNNDTKTESVEQLIVSVETASSNLQSIQSNQPNQIDAFFRDFQQAIANDEKETVVSFLDFPLQINVVDNKNKFRIIKIETKESLLKNYNAIFDGKLKQFISQTKPEKFLVTANGEISTLRGEIRMTSLYKRDTKKLEIKVVKLTKNQN